MWSVFNSTPITSIPAGLFDNNTKVTSFGYAFFNCINLTTVPAGLFAKNTLATNFSYTFQDCTKLQLNPNIFCDDVAERATRFSGKTMNFSFCFNLRPAFTGSQGTAPALWLYTMNAASTKTTCFTGQTAASLTNFASIPAEWK